MKRRQSTQYLGLSSLKFFQKFFQNFGFELDPEIAPVLS